jgi:hypothetical protein
MEATRDYRTIRERCNYANVMSAERLGNKKFAWWIAAGISPEKIFKKSMSVVRTLPGDRPCHRRAFLRGVAEESLRYFGKLPPPQKEALNDDFRTIVLLPMRFDSFMGMKSHGPVEIEYYDLVYMSKQAGLKGVEL